MTILHAVVGLLLLTALLMSWRRWRVNARRPSAKVVADGLLNLGASPRPCAGYAFAAQGDTTAGRWSPEVPGQAAGSAAMPSHRPGALAPRAAAQAHPVMLSAGRFHRLDSRDDVQRGHQEPWAAAPAAPCPRAKTSLPDERYRGTLESLPVAVFMTDKQRSIVLANAAADKLFGYAPDELIGVLSDVLLPALPVVPHAPPPAGTVPGPPRRAVGPGRDMVARRKDGTEFPAEITTNPVSWDNEPYALTVVIDRTERYELHRNRQQLAHLTRVSTLGALAGSLAHELNQPLTAILSNAQAAQRFMATQPIDLAEVREILHDLVEDNHRASEVIRKIRALVKKGEIEAAPLSIAGVIEDVALLVHSDAIVRGIRVFLHLAPELPPVHGDRVQLQQVVLNLLFNAFDALECPSAHGCAVTIEASLDNESAVRVAVRDSGPGIASDTFDKLFLPFFTSKREGLGLGLSISRSIVDTHGGHIWAENNPDQGATFYFTLPVGVTAARAPSWEQS